MVTAILILVLIAVLGGFGVFIYSMMNSDVVTISMFFAAGSKTFVEIIAAIIEMISKINE